MKKPLLILLILCVPLLFFSQEGSLDTSFNSNDVGFGYGDGPSSTVNTIAVQNDGKIIIGGNFTSYNGIGRNRIARINASSVLSTLDIGSENTLHFYPNPVKDVLHITTNSTLDFKQVNIYTVLGKYLYSEKSLAIDISHLSNGVYIFEVETNQGKQRHKVIIK